MEVFWLQDMTKTYRLCILKRSVTAQPTGLHLTAGVSCQRLLHVLHIRCSHGGGGSGAQPSSRTPRALRHFSTLKHEEQRAEEIKERPDACVWRAICCAHFRPHLTCPSPVFVPALVHFSPNISRVCSLSLVSLSFVLVSRPLCCLTRAHTILPGRQPTFTPDTTPPTSSSARPLF
jgi:hypothetical protein